MDKVTADSLGLAPKILCKTRTGTKVHVGSDTSASVMCGHWLRFNAGRLKVDSCDHADLCERCVNSLRAAGYHTTA